LNNWLLIETSQNKEPHVARAINELGCGTYLAMSLAYKSISRHSKIKRPIETPIIPRLVFASSSYPRLSDISAVRHVARIIRNAYGEAVVVPGWQVREFQLKVDECRHAAASGHLPAIPKAKAKWLPLKSENVFAQLMEIFNVETGEILEVA
jgi:hypothetical protein